MEEVTINLTTDCQNLHRTGKQKLGGHNRTLCTRTQEKGTVTPQEHVLELPVRVRESLVKAWVVVACCRVGDTDYSSTYLDNMYIVHI